MAKTKMSKKKNIEGINSEEVNPEGKKVELKWKHYLYEFLIVALGISIPFTLSKWNENIINRNTEEQYYRSFLQELKDDMNSMDGIIVENAHQIQIFTYASNIILNDDQHQLADTLAKIAIEFRRYSDFQKKNSIYEVLSNSGEVDVFRNKQILLKLQRIESLYTYINRLEAAHQDLIFLVFMDVLEKIRLNPVEIIDLEGLYGFEFHNTVELFVDITKEKHGLYQQAENQLQDLIASLEQELVNYSS